MPGEQVQQAAESMEGQQAAPAAVSPRTRAEGWIDALAQRLRQAVEPWGSTVTPINPPADALRVRKGIAGKTGERLQVPVGLPFFVADGHYFEAIYGRVRPYADLDMALDDHARQNLDRRALARNVRDAFAAVFPTGFHSIRVTQNPGKFSAHVITRGAGWYSCGKAFESVHGTAINDELSLCAELARVNRLRRGLKLQPLVLRIDPAVYKSEGSQQLLRMIGQSKATEPGEAPKPVAQLLDDDFLPIDLARMWREKRNEEATGFWLDSLVTYTEEEERAADDVEGFVRQSAAAPIDLADPALQGFAGRLERDFAPIDADQLTALVDLVPADRAVTRADWRSGCAAIRSAYWIDAATRRALAHRFAAKCSDKYKASETTHMFDSDLFGGCVTTLFNWVRAANPQGAAEWLRTLESRRVVDVPDEIDLEIERAFEAAQAAAAAQATETADERAKRLTRERVARCRAAKKAAAVAIGEPSEADDDAVSVAASSEADASAATEVAPAFDHDDAFCWTDFKTLAQSQKFAKGVDFLRFCRTHLHRVFAMVADPASFVYKVSADTIETTAPAFAANDLIKNFRISVRDQSIKLGAFVAEHEHRMPLIHKLRTVQKPSGEHDAATEVNIAPRLETRPLAEPLTAEQLARVDAFRGWLRETFTAHDQDQADEIAGHMMEWLAALYNSPDDRLGQMLLMYGPEGTGKSTLANFCQILVGDRHTCVAPNPSKLLDGSFNGLSDGRRLICIEEAYDSGKQHAHANELKSLIDGKTMQINQKYGGQFQRRNIGAYLVSTNYINSVEIDGGGRRIFVVQTSRAHQVVKGAPNHAEAVAYWSRVYAEFICADFARVFATWAMAQPRRPFGWHQSHAPITAIKEEVKRVTAPPLVRFVAWARELIAAAAADEIANPIPLQFAMLNEQRISPKQLYDLYENWCVNVERMDRRFVMGSGKFGAEAKQQIANKRLKTGVIYDLRQDA